jgi:hypothetical protein
MSFSQYCKLLGYLYKKKQTNKNQQLNTSYTTYIVFILSSTISYPSRCIRLDGPAARCSGRPKLPWQFVPVRNFEPRLFVPMPGNMGRPAFTFINLYIFCNLQRIINKNIHLGYVCTCVYIF